MESICEGDVRCGSPPGFFSLQTLAPKAALGLQARRKRGSVEAAYGKLLWTGLPVTGLKQQWTLIISVSMGQDLRSCLLGDFFPLLCMTKDACDA